MALDDRDLEARRRPRRPATTSPAGPAPITMTSSSRWLMAWHPDGMGRIVAVPLAAALAVVSACGGSSGDAKTTSGTPAQTAPATGGASRALHLVQVGTFDSPVYVTSPPGDARRLLVVEQGGTIRVVRGGRKLARPFLDIRSRVVERRGAGPAVDRVRARLRAIASLLGLLHEPRRRRGDRRVPRVLARSREPAARRSASSSRPTPSPTTTAGSCSWVPTATSTPAWATAAAANDQHGARGNGQNLGTLLGKIIRIQPRAGGGYTIPTSNPFVGPRGRARRDLLLRPAQSVALLVRPCDGRHRHRRRRPERDRGDRLPQARHRQGRELRLAPVGGQAAQLQRARAAARCSRRSPRATATAGARSPAATSCATMRCGASTGATSTATTARAQIRAVKLSQSRATRRHARWR